MPIVQQGPGNGSCLVTGNLQTLGSGIAQGFIIFQLYNLPQGAIPQVLGITDFPSLQYIALSDAQGNFSTLLWGNDVITPSNTQYLVTFRDFTGHEVGPALFNIVGPSFNMNTALPATITVPPVYTSTSYASGAAVSAANFAIAGWGAGATVTNITGVQERCSITITAGTGAVVAPTVTFTYPGPYPTQAWNLAQMINGTGQIRAITSSTTVAVATFTYSGLPLLAQTFVLVFDTKGN